MHTGRLFDVFKIVMVDQLYLALRLLNVSASVDPEPCEHLRNFFLCFRWQKSLHKCNHPRAHQFMDGRLNNAKCYGNQVNQVDIAGAINNGCYLKPL